MSEGEPTDETTSEEELADEFIQYKKQWEVVHNYEQYRLPRSILPDGTDLSTQKNHLREVDLVMEDEKSNHWVIEIKKSGKGIDFDTVFGQALVSKSLYIKDKDIDPNRIKSAVVVNDTRSGKLYYNNEQLVSEGIDAYPKSDGDVPDRMLYEICRICRNHGVEIYSKIYGGESFEKLTDQNIMED